MAGDGRLRKLSLIDGITSCCWNLRLSWSRLTMVTRSRT